MFRAILVSLLFAGATLAGGQASAQPTPPPSATAPPAAAAGMPPMPASTAPNDYADKANWLCWPGRDDPCANDLTTTVVKADGTTSTETFKADPKAPIDCFYVYPTVSADPGIFSDMIPGPEEKNVVVQQAARLAAHCRLYAPMYRQFTLTALVYFMTHPPAPGAQPPAARPQLGYNDVVDAWNYYLMHENHGQGVVLVGHSQGSGVLTQLIKNEIDGKPDQAKLVSAILMGTVLTVPEGKDVGGDFKSVPLCHAASQTGCAIAYSSFREATLPPPDNSRFGRPRTEAPGMEAACVNPANLAGGSGEAQSYFGVTAITGQRAPYEWVKGKTIDTPFISPAGMLSAQCTHAGPFHVLAIHINADPGPRAADIPGDVVVGGAVQKDWGLHLIDANLFMGNLVDIVGAESKAWAAKPR